MKELNQKSKICTKDGKVNKDSIGWSNKVFSNCAIEKGYFRKKIWNHYMFMNKKYICAFALVKLDYAGLIFIDFYNLKDKTQIHKTMTVPLCLGMIIHNKIGSYAHYQNKEVYMNIIRKNEKLNITIKWDEIDIDAKIHLEKESLNVLIPWYEKKFHYTSKQLPLKAQGCIKVEEEKYEKFDLGSSIAFIDYGRGIWPREKSWYWLTCGFKYNDEKIGLNLGGKWTDNTGVNENCIKINKVLYKIYSDIIFTKIDENTWSIKSVDIAKEDEFVDLIYTIEYMYDKVNDKVIVKSSLKQYIGRLSGVVKVNGKEVVFDKIICWFEDHYAKW